MDSAAFERTLTRLAHEIIERDGTEGIVLVGIIRRGVPIAEMLNKNLFEITGHTVPYGKLDITFYRDDLTRSSDSPILKNTHLPFSVEDKTIVLVDDVLFTGRTCRAAIEAIMQLGRPRRIRLCVLIDRGHRELPIRADYVGKNIPTSLKEQIAVYVPEYDNSLGVELLGINETE